MDLEGLQPPSRVSVERSSDLGGKTAWVPVAETTASFTDAMSLTVRRNLDEINAFFRVRAESIPVEVQADPNGYLMQVGESLPFPDVLAAFAHSTGEMPHLVREYDPTDEQSLVLLPNDRIVPAGVYSFSNLEELGSQLKLPLWMPAPVKDQPELIGRYPATELGQIRSEVGEPVDPPGDDGEGDMGSWRGDNVDLDPVQIEEPPKTPFKEGKMEFNPDVPPAKGGNQDDEGLVDPHSHVRLVLRFKQGGEVSLEEAIELANGGDAANQAPPPLPGPGNYVVVARSPNVGQPGGIYHIGTILDPLEVRAYDPPHDGVHGSQTRETGTARMRLPLVVPDLPAETALKGVSVTLYRFREGFGELLERDQPLLTPAYFAEREQFFEQIQQFDDGRIIELLGKRPQKPERQELQNHATLGSPTIETLHRSGSNGAKFNICVIADGFDSSASDQDEYADYVDNNIVEIFHSVGMHPEILNAVNIFRIDTVSVDSGVTQVDADGEVTTSRDTALGYEYSGVWDRCWMEPGPNSNSTIDSIVDDLCPQADQIVLVLNERGGGGCARGDSFALTLRSTRGTVAHELGHSFGNLGDEYQCSQGGDDCGVYTGGNLSAPNLDNRSNRNTVGWSLWIPSWRPVPTTFSQVADNIQDVGIFAGATRGSRQWWDGIFRPTGTGRMRSSGAAHNPIGYTSMRANARPRQEATFRKNAVGDFNGDGLTDIVLLDGRQLSLHLAAERDLGPDDPITGSPTRNQSAVLKPTWFNTHYIRNSSTGLTWQTRPGDILLPGDFDGDGLTDLYVINLDNWNQPYVAMLRSLGDRFEPVARYDRNLPGWQMTRGDEFYVGDMTGDGRDDLMVFNGSNWAIPYFGMFRSQGSSLAYLRRYDKFLPGWEMGKREKFHVGDFDGDGIDDVIAFNRRDWRRVHLQVQLGTGSGLTLADRHYGVIEPGASGWQMRRRDDLHVLDFRGNERDDVILFNGRDWTPTYLGMLESDEKGRLFVNRRYDSSNNELPGWDMRSRDRHWVGDVDGDGREDLVVFNADNWSSEYLGMLKSQNEIGLRGSWQRNRIGAWNLHGFDDFAVGDFRGTAGWADLFVFNDGWFGLLRSYSSRYVNETIYRKWIRNHRFHGHGWW